jgi:hypothetical protein
LLGLKQPSRSKAARLAAKLRAAADIASAVLEEKKAKVKLAKARKEKAKAASAEAQQGGSADSCRSAEAALSKARNAVNKASSHVDDAEWAEREAREEAEYAEAELKREENAAPVDKATSAGPVDKAASAGKKRRKSKAKSKIVSTTAEEVLSMMSEGEGAGPASAVADGAALAAVEAAEGEDGAGAGAAAAAADGGGKGSGAAAAAGDNAPPVMYISSSSDDDEDEEGKDSAFARAMMMSASDALFRVGPASVLKGTESKLRSEIDKLSIKLALSESRLTAAEAENADLRRQLATLTSVDREDVDTGLTESVQLSHEETVVRHRKRDASTALSTLAETTEIVVRVKKEKVEITEELLDREDLAMFQELHTDRLMSYIDALKKQVCDLGGVPEPRPLVGASDA